VYVLEQLKRMKGFQIRGIKGKELKYASVSRGARTGMKKISTIPPDDHARPLSNADTGMQSLSRSRDTLVESEHRNSTIGG